MPDVDTLGQCLLEALDELKDRVGHEAAGPARAQEDRGVIEADGEEAVSVRRYVPHDPRRARSRLASADGPELTDPVLAEDESEEAEYAALMTAADASAELVAGLPDGARRRVVLVAESAVADQPVTWRDVGAVHVDTEDDAADDDDLAWFATQEIGDLIASL